MEASELTKAVEAVTARIGLVQTCCLSLAQRIRLASIQKDRISLCEKRGALIEAWYEASTDLRVLRDEFHQQARHQWEIANAKAGHLPGIKDRERTFATYVDAWVARCEAALAHCDIRDFQFTDTGNLRGTPLEFADFLDACASVAVRDDNDAESLLAGVRREAAFVAAGIATGTVENRANSRANNPKKSHPKSPDVRDLCTELKRQRGKGKPDIEIAREYTGGNEKLAQSLMAQARRFPWLWRDE